MDWIIEADRPIWLQLYEQLTLRIITGIYPMGSRMPSVRDLAAEAGVNPNTMQRALSYLEEQGMVVTNRTAGRLVTEDRERLDDIRLGLAKERIQAYLQGMQVLGYTEDEARELLQKEM